MWEFEFSGAANENDSVETHYEKSAIQSILPCALTLLPFKIEGFSLMEYFFGNFFLPFS